MTLMKQLQGNLKEEKLLSDIWQGQSHINNKSQNAKQVHNPKTQLIIYQTAQLLENKYRYILFLVFSGGKKSKHVSIF